MTFYVEKYKIVHTSSFELELYQILKYISFNLLETNIAKKFYKSVKEKINSLTYLPERNAKIYLNDKNFRKILVNNYLIIYEVDNDTRTNLYLTYFSW
ncbi:MAG: type II toxin-antitoxin system RelE/ParE family toxin [Clostridia bacterium]|nr:type II toxin-antitoxin system RelE/ParE family toxin [Clostridia bacterium]